jgi:hypothetical protein
MTAYRYSDKQRAEWIVDILAAADDKPDHRTYALALAEYWATVAPGFADGEPTADDLKGVTWKVETALSADFANIHQPELPPGVHGGEYSRDHLRLRGHARQAALRGARERRMRQEAAERRAAESLGDLLSFDSKGEERERDA